MKTTSIYYDGGSLNTPDNGVIIEVITNEDDYDHQAGRTLVVFTAFCFNSDGTWRPEVITALRNLIDGKDQLM